MFYKANEIEASESCEAPVKIGQPSEKDNE